MSFDGKKSKYIISVLIIIFIIIGVIFCILNKDFSEERWVKKNSISLDVKDHNDFSSLEVLKKDIDNNEVFLTGEHHGVNINDDIDLKFLKFFKKEAKIKYYLVELPAYQGVWLNEYLKTGNKFFLEKVMVSNYLNEIVWNKEFYNKWKEIYEFNKSLPKDEKIKVIALDFFGEIDEYFECLNSIADKHKNNSSEGIKNLKDIFKEYKDITDDPKFYDYNKLYKTEENSVLKLKKDIKSRESFYKEYLQEDFCSFVYIVDNFYYKLHSHNIGGRDDKVVRNYRDDKMYENFRYMQSKLPKGKYYGHFGSYHVLKQTHQLGKLMNNNDSPVKGKVLSIFSDYVNCLVLDYDNQYDYTNKDKEMLNNKIIHPLKKIKDSNNMLIKVQGKKSPFNKNKLESYLSGKYISFFEEQIEKSGKSLADFCDYILVNFDGKASTPYKNFSNIEEFNKYKDNLNNIGKE